MKKNILMALSLMAFMSCSGDDNVNVGQQVDRMGRPAINTTLNATFTADADRAAAEMSYNQTLNANASAAFSAEIANNLGIYDSLVASCGDNAITNRAAVGADTSLATGADRYSLLAGVLADDQLYINSAAGGTCNQYLAAEVTVLGTDLSGDCGGRTPSMDIIETSYSVLAAGAVSGVDDGVSADAAVGAQATFPFLAPPA